VEVAERFADGLATREELAAAARDAVQRRAFLGAYQNSQYDDDCFYAGQVIAQYAAAAGPDPAACRLGDLTFAVAFLASGDIPGRHPPADKIKASAAEEQAALCRDIFGNPFRRVAVDPAWLASQGGTVARLARAAYDNRQLPSGLLDNAHIAVLADALEEAGCQDPQILDHLRSGRDHVRGCFVLDLLRGKS
jgi:hypothetical protein